MTKNITRILSNAVSDRSENINTTLNKIEDISTIISIFPKTFNEFKPGLNPCTFNIPACKNESEPVAVRIYQAIHNIYVGDGNSVPVKDSSVDVAEAIVNDILNGMTLIDSYGKPGLLVVNDDISSEEFVLNYDKEYTELQKSQIAWYKKIIVLADDLWIQHHQHSEISDIQRIAAKKLNLTREWLEVSEATVPIKCPACTSLISNEAIICPVCKVIIKPVEYKKFQIAS